MSCTCVKSDRLLQIYSRLVSGEVLNKRELAQHFCVTERSVQRDMEALRCFFAEQGLQQNIVYDRQHRGYRLEAENSSKMENSEVLAVCKILLESRSMRRDELFPILDKLISCCVPETNQKFIQKLIANERFYYIEPHHGKPLLEIVLKIGQAIQRKSVLEIQYERMKEPKLVWRKVFPAGIMFSEYYFYLTAFLEDKTDFENPDDIFPTIYRIDRIQEIKVLDEHFEIPYADRFQEGEFRKRVQFMYGGRLEKIRFKYTGPSIEAVLDRLPTAKIERREDDGWIVRAEVFGRGIEMWLRSQGDLIQLLE